MMDSIVSWIISASYSLIPAFAESIWRGILLAVAVGITLHVMHISASRRHALWLLALIFITLLPILVSVPFNPAVQGSLPENKAALPIHVPQTVFQIPVPIAATLLAILLLIAFARVLLFLRACKSLSKLKGESTSAPEWMEILLADCAHASFLHRKITVRISRRITTPALVGFFKPSVLFPEHLIVHLQAEEIRQILLHEIAHLKRHDDWTILFQQLMSTLYFFNPIIFWITKQMNLQREIACDDSVIASGGTPQSYALCLTRLAEFSRPMMMAAPIPSATSQLSRRVEMLLSRSKKNSAGSIVLAVCSVIVISMFGLWISHASPLFAVTDENQSVTTTQIEPMNAAVAEEETFATNDDFKSASQRMKDAQQKMEAAREELLQAAEAMRKSHQALDSCSGVECEEMKESEYEHRMKKFDAHDEAMHEHERSMRHSEKRMREAERELEWEESREGLPPLPEIVQTPPTTTTPALAPLAEAPLSNPAPLSSLSPVAAPAPAAPLPPNPEVPPAPKAVPKPEKPPRY